MWQATAMPHVTGRGKGCSAQAGGGGSQGIPQQHPMSPSTSPVPAARTAGTQHRLGGGERSALGRGSSGRGLLAASPFLFTAQGASGLPRGVCGADVREMEARQCPAVKLFSRRWAASFQL